MDKMWHKSTHLVDGNDFLVKGVQVACTQLYMLHSVQIARQISFARGDGIIGKYVEEWVFALLALKTKALTPDHEQLVHSEYGDQV